MNIAIDISQAVYEGTGVARFTTGLVKSILEYDSQHEWTFFYSSFRKNLHPDLLLDINKSGQNLKHITLPPRALSFLWNDLHIIPFEKLTKTSYDWIITSDWTEPPASSKKATIVHDLAYLQYPNTVNETILKTQQTRMKHVTQETSLIFADSKTTRNDLIHYLQFPESKIVVNYPGVAIKRAKNSETVLKKYKLHKPFILSVGKIEPRKNLNKLIDAFEALGLGNYELVIAGPAGWESLKPRANVKLIGYVSDEELAQLYQSCLCFVYPSLWEGFGYPVVEAMLLDAPVATSNTSSLREIGEGAALLFDPHKVESISRALKAIITDEKLRAELTNKGRVKAEKFSWKNYLTIMLQELSRR